MFIYNKNSTDRDKILYDSYIDGGVYFYFGDKKLDFKVKDYNFSNHSSIVISNNLFESLKDNQDIYTYIVRYNSKKDYNNRKTLGHKEINLATMDELNKCEYLSKIIGYLNYASFICIFVFIIAVLVVNKNIVADLKTKMGLEMRLGYTNKMIRLNVIKRLILLHSLAFLFSVILSLFLVVIINKILNIVIVTDYMYLGVRLTIIIVISDLVLGGLIKIKYYLIVIDNKSLK